MFLYKMGGTGPEEKVRIAEAALEKARAKYEAALDQTAAESTRHAADIDSLATVIATKRERVTALDELAGGISNTWSAISGLLTNA